MRLAAHQERTTLSNLVRQVLWDFLQKYRDTKNELSSHKILAATAKIKELCALSRVTKLPLQKGDEEAIIAERQRKRGRMLEVGMDAFENIYQVAKSEKSAEEAQYRVQAYQVLARLGAFNAALLRDASEDEILAKMIQLEEENERLEAMGREIQSRANQEAAAAQQPSNPAGKTK